MNLYLLSQYINDGYDTYSDCVVAANSPEDAAKIHPNGDIFGLKIHLENGKIQENNWHSNHGCVESLEACAKQYPEDVIVDSGECKWQGKDNWLYVHLWNMNGKNTRDWAQTPSQVTVRLIGIATPDIQENSVVCASFQAG